MKIHRSIAMVLLLGACTTTQTGGGSPTASPPLLGGAPPTVPCATTPDWRAAPAVTAPSVVSYFHAITGKDARDVWAGGYALNATGEQVLLARYRAGAWVQEPTTTPGKINGMAVTDDATWAVGQSDGKLLTMRWSGRTWGTVPPPTIKGASEALLNDVASANGTLIAVGSSDHDSGTRTRAFTWNGSRWIAAPAPASETTGRLMAVAGAGDIMWAVGRDESGDSPKAMIMRGTGTTWKREPIPTVGTFSELEAVTAISATDVWVGGSFWDAKGAHSLLMHYDGKAWTVVNHPAGGITGERGGPTPPYGPSIAAVWASAPDDVWAVGEKELQKDRAELIERFFAVHFDGTTWTEVEIPRASDDTSVLTDGISFTPTDVFLAGFAFTETSGDVTATLISRACLP